MPFPFLGSVLLGECLARFAFFSASLLLLICFEAFVFFFRAYN